MSKKILCIVGPTSSGKTSLALSVAKLLNHPVSLISVDTRQNYKNLTILSGKDKPTVLESRISYHGADDLQADEEQNLAIFSKKYKKLIDDDFKSGKQIILVGGSGLFIKSLTSGLDLIYVPKNNSLRSEMENLSIQRLQEKLQKLDPITYSQLNNSDIHNPRRLIRKIEIASNQGEHRTPVTPERYKYIWVGLKISADSLKSKIAERISSRISQGVLQEVDEFRKKHLQISPQIQTTLGYQDICQYLDGKVTMDEMKERWLIEELNYAKRQMVWFKKQESIIWYDESINRSDLAKKIVSILNENS